MKRSFLALSLLYLGPFHWSCRAPSPDHVLMLCEHPWEQLHHDQGGTGTFEPQLSPSGSQQLGALAGPDPESVGFDHLYILSRQPWATVQ